MIEMIEIGENMLLPNVWCVWSWQLVGFTAIASRGVFEEWDNGWAAASH